jgi:hypothetical protein
MLSRVKKNLLIIDILLLDYSGIIATGAGMYPKFLLWVVLWKKSYFGQRRTFFGKSRLYLYNSCGILLL